LPTLVVVAGDDLRERGVRAEVGGDGEAGGARRVPGPGARLLHAPAAMEQGRGRDDPGVQAVHGQGLLKLS
jgi:hypothetical protein